MNKVYHKDFLNNDLPDKSVNLIIADFPYFKVKGEFDFIWNSFDEFLAWVELCAKEFKRLLKDNGTLFVYGHAKKIAYKQVIFDKYFNLENSLVWKKKECQTLRSDFEQARCFAPITERILMYSNEDLDRYSFPLYKAQEYIKKMIYENGGNVTNANIFYCNKTGFVGNYRGNFFGKSQYVFYTKQQYEVLCEYIKSLGYKDDFLEYESLRLEYEALRRPFENSNKLTDVLEFSQETHITMNYDHDTKKPETLTRALILTCSRENDLVLVPFAGSGTECAMAKKEKRNFIGFDINPEYVEMSNKRCDAIQSGLF